MITKSTIKIMRRITYSSLWFIFLFCNLSCNQDYKGETNTTDTEDVPEPPTNIVGKESPNSNAGPNSINNSPNSGNTIVNINAKELIFNVNKDTCACRKENRAMLVGLLNELNTFNINNGNNFKITPDYDLPNGKFKAVNDDMSITFSRDSKEQNNLIIEFQFGYDVSVKISNFEKGRYRTPKSEKAINTFTEFISSLLENDFKPSKITGEIYGYADSTDNDVIKGSVYKGDICGLIDENIDDQPFSIKKFDEYGRYSGIEDDTISLLSNYTQLRNIDFAFLRAFDLKKSLLDNIIAPNQDYPIIEPQSLWICVTEIKTSSNMANRKVTATLHFIGSLKKTIDNLRLLDKNNN